MSSADIGKLWVVGHKTQVQVMLGTDVSPSVSMHYNKSTVISVDFTRWRQTSNALNFSGQVSEVSLVKF